MPFSVSCIHSGIGGEHMHIAAQTKYQVKLPEEEKVSLTHLITKGVAKARTITRARILLSSNEGKTDKDICQALGVDRTTVYHIRKRYVQEGLQSALHEKPRPGKERILSDADEATITAIACSDPKEGYARWTVDLITEEFNGKTKKNVCRNTVWKVMQRNKLKPHLKKNVVNSKGNTAV